MKKIFYCLIFLFLCLLIDYKVVEAKIEIKLPGDYKITVSKNEKKYENLNEKYFSCKYSGTRQGKKGYVVYVVFEDDYVYISTNLKSSESTSILNSDDKLMKFQKSGNGYSLGNGSYRVDTVFDDIIWNNKYLSDTESFSSYNEIMNANLKIESFEKENGSICPGYFNISQKNGVYDFKLSNTPITSGVYLASAGITDIEQELNECVKNKDCQTPSSNNTDEITDNTDEITDFPVVSCYFSDENSKASFNFQKNADGGYDVGTIKNVFYNGSSVETTGIIESTNSSDSGLFEIFKNGNCPAKLIMYKSSAEDKYKLYTGNNEYMSKLKTDLINKDWDNNDIIVEMHLVSYNTFLTDLNNQMKVINSYLDACKEKSNIAECNETKKNILSKFNSLKIDYQVLTEFKILDSKSEAYKKYNEYVEKIDEISDENMDLSGCIIDEGTQSIIDWIMNLIRFGGVVLLIVLGMLDFVKAAASGEQEEMKKSKSKFVKRLIACVVLFFIPIIVNILVGLVNLGSGENCNSSSKTTTDVKA